MVLAVQPTGGVWSPAGGQADRHPPPSSQDRRPLPQQLLLQARPPPDHQVGGISEEIGSDNGPRLNSSRGQNML